MRKLVVGVGAVMFAIAPVMAASAYEPSAPSRRSEPQSVQAKPTQIVWGWIGPVCGARAIREYNFADGAYYAVNLGTVVVPCSWIQ